MKVTPKSAVSTPRSPKSNDSAHKITATSTMQTTTPAPAHGVVKRLRRSTSVQPDSGQPSGGWTNDDDSGLDESAHPKSLGIGADEDEDEDDDDEEEEDLEEEEEEEEDDEIEDEEEEDEEEDFATFATSGDDAVSETGTYTIGQDSPSLEEDQSRRDIERVFGLLGDPAAVSCSTSTSPSVVSLTPNWIREWAAQVAQQQEAPLAHLCGVSKPPSAPPRPPEVHAPAQRPRRRLPSVPSAGPGSSGARSRSSPRPSDMSDPSDSSLETESFLRDTESVVSAMQARVDGRSSTESDIETRSSSSYRHSNQQQQQQQHSMEHENSLGRKLSAQLRAKIRSLDESYPSPSINSGNSGNSGNRSLRETSTPTTTTTAAAAATVIHNELHCSEDVKSLHSDSSSDLTYGEAARSSSSNSRSRHTTHDERKTSGQVPAVRYNRALSLRRGRLGLDVEALPAVATAKERRNTNASPSRGVSPQVATGRKHSTSSATATATANSSMKSPALPLQPGSNDFSRSDGGRFSLRVGSKSSASACSANNASSTPVA